MEARVSDFARAISRAYYTGVAVSAILLALWLMAGTIVAIRARRAGKSRNVAGVILAGYVLTGYVGYLAILEPIVTWFVRRVAGFEPIFHGWVRNGIPAVLILICIVTTDFASRTYRA